MFYFLEGKVLKKTASEVLVKSGDFGFLIRVSSRLLEKLNEGDHVFLYTAFVFRNDVFEVFGFEELFERDLFDLLKSIESVGPKLAFKIIATLGKEGIAEAVYKKNPVLLEKVEGIGKKSALKILLELVNKLDPKLLGSYEAENEEIKLARQALEQLGVRGEEIARVFSKLDFGKIKTADEIVKEALRRMGSE